MDTPLWQLRSLYPPKGYIAMVNSVFLNGRPHHFSTLGGAIRSWTLLVQERMQLLHWDKELTTPG